MTLFISSAPHVVKKVHVLPLVALYSFLHSIMFFIVLILMTPALCSTWEVQVYLSVNFKYSVLCYFY